MLRFTLISFPSFLSPMLLVLWTLGVLACLDNMTQVSSQVGEELQQKTPLVCPEKVSENLKKMDEIIHHKYADIRGLRLHIAEAGSGDKVVVFLHGFPELWYSWRHQMIAVAKAGYRAIAPDFRGYGLSEVPPEPEKTTWQDLIDDLLGIFDFLAIPKAFVVGKDAGIRPAYHFAVLHPERVTGVITLGGAYPPSVVQPAVGRQAPLPEGFYISRWQEPGRAEADFGRFDVKTVVKNIYILFSRSDIPVAEEGKEVMDLVDPSTPLPSWFTEEDLSVYTNAYEKSGFRTPLQVPYRSMGEQLQLNGAKEIVMAPTLLIMGKKDYFLKFPGVEEFVTSGKVKEYVPDLKIKWLSEGCHFVQEQFPDEVNRLIINFLSKHVRSPN